MDSGGMGLRPVSPEVGDGIGAGRRGTGELEWHRGFADGRVRWQWIPRSSEFVKAMNPRICSHPVSTRGFLSGRRYRGIAMKSYG